MGRTYSCWMLNLLVHHVTGRLSKVNLSTGDRQPPIKSCTWRDHSDCQTFWGLFSLPLQSTSDCNILCKPTDICKAKLTAGNDLLLRVKYACNVNICNTQEQVELSLQDGRRRNRDWTAAGSGHFHFYTVSGPALGFILHLTQRNVGSSAEDKADGARS